jgi:Flp pilus assembly protein TadG
MTLRFVRSTAAQDGGQSLVEVALALPILLLIVLGIVDVGRAYAYKSAVTNAAREAAIYAARDPQAGLNAVCQRARDELGAGAAAKPCSTTPIAVQCVRAGAPCGDASAVLFQSGGGADVTVTVRYDVSLLTTYLVGKAFRIAPLPVSATATMGGLGE